jgi:hypothetical protein
MWRWLAAQFCLLAVTLGQVSQLRTYPFKGQRPRLASGSKGDVVYLGRLIAPSCTSNRLEIKRQNGRGRGCGLPMAVCTLYSCPHEAHLNSFLGSDRHLSQHDLYCDGSFKGLGLASCSSRGCSAESSC